MQAKEAVRSDEQTDESDSTDGRAKAGDRTAAQGNPGPACLPTTDGGAGCCRGQDARRSRWVVGGWPDATGGVAADLSQQGTRRAVCPPLQGRPGQPYP